MNQRKRQTRPEMELLERRQLLHARLTIGGHEINDQDLSRFLLQKENNTPVTDRRIKYTTPQGTHVIVTLYGLGSLKGSTVNPDGSLSLVYAHTAAGSGIVGKVSGGTGQADLESIRHAGSMALDLTGTGSDPVGPVNLKDFNLLNGGSINLTGGVGKLILRSMGSNSQIHLKELPATSSSSTSTGQSTTSGTGTSSGTSTLSSTTSGTSSTPSMLGTPNGVMVVVSHVAGGGQSTPAFGHAQFFAYDPQANALVRFDANTGAALQTIPLPSSGQQFAGVALGRDFGHQVALVGLGSTVYAFDAVSGAPVGQFSTNNLNIGAIDGMGSTATRTVLIDSSAGVAQMINVSMSLESGQAQGVGGPFTPQREFHFNGGATGVAGSQTIYATGAAHFDQFQPDTTQLGIMALSTGGNQLNETSRTEITSPAVVNTGMSGQSTPSQALGSIDQQLALVTNATTHTVTLYNPKTLTVTGTVNLVHSGPLEGLSESFHPELAGEALVDVQGSMSSFRAVDARNLVINDGGTLGYVQIGQASNTAIIGDPVNHVNIPVRQNVTILSTSRIDPTTRASIDGRGGVTVNPNMKPVGPLSLP